MIVVVPSGSEFGDRVATPLLSVALPSVVAPAVKVTVPDGLPPPLRVTVAVSGMGWPNSDGFTSEVSAVVVVALLTVTVTVGDVLLK